jgi:hypothetical protein
VSHCSHPLSSLVCFSVHIGPLLIALGAGLAVGLAGLAAGFAIGIVGDVSDLSLPWPF